MLKTKLPVIILRNMVLLPLGELKLEIEKEKFKLTPQKYKES